MSDISRLGNFFKSANILPDKIISSTAMRALQSAELIAERLDQDRSSIVLHDDLYDSSVRLILKIVSELSAELANVFLVGHNPNLLYFAEFTTRAEAGVLEAGGFMQLTWQADDWQGLTDKQATLADARNPSDY